MAEQAGLSFAGLLRQLRDEAGLTQEELAEAARVSQRACGHDPLRQRRGIAGAGPVVAVGVGAERLRRLPVPMQFGR